MKFKFTAKAIIPALIFLFGFIFMILFIQSTGDPLGHYPKAHEGTPLAEAEAFIFSAEHIINFVFGMIFAVYGLLFALELFFHAKSSHILMVIIGSLLLFAHAVARIIWGIQNINEFSKSMPFILFYIGAALTSVGCLYSFVKKSLDGDAGASYWVFFILAVIFSFFGGVSRYSLLDAFGNGSSPVYWSGYATTRFALLILAELGIVNTLSDYDPNPIQLDQFGNPIDVTK